VGQNTGAEGLGQWADAHALFVSGKGVISKGPEDLCGLC
jgi:hypothetical protein